jgi:hypothetical protein
MKPNQHLRPFSPGGRQRCERGHYTPGRVGGAPSPPPMAIFHQRLIRNSGSSPHCTPDKDRSSHAICVSRLWQLTRCTVHLFHDSGKRLSGTHSPLLEGATRQPACQALGQGNRSDLSPLGRPGGFVLSNTLSCGLPVGVIGRAYQGTAGNLQKS